MGLLLEELFGREDFFLIWGDVLKSVEVVIEAHPESEAEAKFPEEEPVEQEQAEPGFRGGGGPPGCHWRH